MVRKKFDSSKDSKVPVLEKGEFVLDFPKMVSEFENAMDKFPVKNILYQTAFQGRGLEFDSYRMFNSGEDASLIDWKASLRSNNLLSKKYVEERNLNIYFLVDVSNSMLFGSRDKLKSEYAAEIIAALSYLVINSGDNAGLVMFSEDIVKILRPSNSKNQFSLIMKFLSDPNFYGGGFNLGKALDHLLRTIKSSYTVFIIISDFIKTRKEHHQSLQLMGSKFETIAIMVRDDVDESFPKAYNQFSIQDPYSNRQMIVDSKIAFEVYRRSALRQKNLLKKLLKESKIDLFEINTRESFASSFPGFLKKRAGRGRI